MGGLKNYLIPTTICFAVGTLALSGFPMLSGWFSKGAILGACYASHHYLYWGIGLLTAGITAIYSVRLFVKVFLGTPRLEKEQLMKLHESSQVMLLPMMILALLSWIGGYAFLGIPGLAHSADLAAHGEAHHLLPTLIEALVILVAIALSWKLNMPNGHSMRTQNASVTSLLMQCFYLDRLFTNRLGVAGTLGFAKVCRWFEVHVVEATLQTLTTTVKQCGTLASVIQRRNAKSFMLATIVGLLFLCWMVLWKV